MKKSKNAIITKAFRIRNQEGKYATLRDGQYVHFVNGRGKVCIGEAALFDFLCDVERYCKTFSWKGKYKDLVVEEYDFTPASTKNIMIWDKRANAYFDMVEEEHKKKQARADAAFEKKYAGAPDPPPMPSLKTIEEKLRRPLKIRTVEGSL
jgi:hypothetical protein